MVVVDSRWSDQASDSKFDGVEIEIRTHHHRIFSIIEFAYIRAFL